MSNSPDVAVMDQMAHRTTNATSQMTGQKIGQTVPVSGANIAQTALAHAAGAGTDVNSKQKVPGLIEMPVSGLLTLRAASEAKSVGDALQAHCQIGLPQRLASQTAGSCCIRWMSPDEWLLSCPLDEAFSIEQHLRETVDGHFAVVNVSGGYSIFELQGHEARSVLMKSTGYDVHPDHFPVGKVVNTTFAKTQVTLRALAVDHYEIIVRRSFSDYLWMWLQRAGKEYGMVFRAAAS